MAGARVLAVAVAAALVAGVYGGSRASAAKLPSPLVGSWTHFFSAAYWTKVGIATEPPEHLSLYIPADGSVAVGEFYIHFSALSGNRVAISGRLDTCKMKAIYGWKVANRRLTLTKLQDASKESAAVFDGVVRAHE